MRSPRVHTQASSLQSGLHPIVWISTAVLLSSCASLREGSPAGKPAGSSAGAPDRYRHEVDAIFLRNREKTYEAAREPIPWQVGQWVITRAADEDGNRSVRRTRIVGHEGGTWTIETEWVDYGKRRESEAIVESVDPTDPRDPRIVRLRTREDRGDVETPDSDSRLFAASSAGLREIFSLLEKRGEPGTPDTAQTPAGTFLGAFRTPVTISREVGSASGDVWYANAVPVIFWARREMKERVFLDTNEVTEEVVDFGLEGAQSTFPPES